MSTRTESVEHVEHVESSAGALPAPPGPPAPAPERGVDADLATARDYAGRILHRARTPLPPLGFRVDWDDQPLRHTVLRGVTRLPLAPPLAGPGAGGPADVPVAVAARRALADDGPPPVTLDQLGDLLACHGVLGRRLELNWNEDSARKLHLSQAVWARPTASGGGMYPMESYVVAHGDAHLPDGVLHHDSAHHSLDVLTRADRTAELAAATGVATTAYLVVSVRFWKNAFKYNSFCYHVVSQDVGCLLASWRLVLAGHGLTCHPVTWFDDAAVARVIDVDGQDEAPFLVVPLGRPVAARPAPAPGSAVRPGAVTRHDRVERSARVRRFPLVQQVHAACTRPDPGPVPDASPGLAVFPAPPPGPVVEAVPGPSGLGTRAALRARRSSFGLLSRTRPLPLAALASVLDVTRTLATAPVDTLAATAPRTRLWVLAAHVEGLERRAYCVDTATGALHGGPAVDLDALQRLYPLSNYSLGQLSAVVAVTVNLEEYLASYGARGYRTAGIEVGHACQAMYVAGAAHDVGVGAVLGVDTTAIDALAGVRGAERTLLCMMLGTERRPSASYDQTLHQARRTGGGPA